jgi:hypothetical protein
MQSTCVTITWLHVQDGPFFPAIEVNTPLSELLHPMLDVAPIKLGALVQVHQNARHIVLRDGMQRSSKIHLLLHYRATPEDAIAAMLHAWLFRCVQSRQVAARSCGHMLLLAIQLACRRTQP